MPPTDSTPLPIEAGLPRIVEALAERGVVVVQAPPGTGKTTAVPPAVAEAVPGRVVVTQPRRIAARAAARRLAHLRGEKLGQSVGYSVRGDRQVGPDTRIEFVTTGVLLRRLQRDPDLPGVGAVVLDEVHERQLESDLALAFCLDVRRNLRPDLRVVAMSATLEADRLTDLADAPLVDVPARLHEITQHWAPPPSGVLAVDHRGVPPAFLDHVAATVRQALAGRDGDVLVFVPGVREIDGVIRRLAGTPGVDLRPLHGRLDASAQDQALQAGPRRRVVVSTAVAESSLTVPGVRIVVDAGLSREPRTDQRRGLPALITVRVSRAAAEQRAGRAGREGPGAVHRCWSRAEHGHLDAHPAPEIAIADLTGFALELAAWGENDLPLLDAPPEPSLHTARATLLGLGAIDESGTITDRGRQIARIPVDPRLARALLDGGEAVGATRAADIVALLADDVRAPGGDLVAALRAGGDWKRTARQLERGVASVPRTSLTDDLAVGFVVALAHPERIARLRPGGSTYLMVSGTGAAFRPGASVAGLPWIAAADVDRRPGSTDAMISSAAPLVEDLALEAAAGFWHEVDLVQWRHGRIEARRATRLGAIELASVRITDPDPALVDRAVREALARDGLDVLRWTQAATALRRRLAFLHHAVGDPWPDMSDDALLQTLPVGTDPSRLDVTTALRGLLPWPEAARLDELAPERVAVAEGPSVAVEYGEHGDEQPVVSVRIQQAFGWRTTPRIADGRVPILVHLLTPARRPAAVTADLESFWNGGYQQVRAELRGRYPKHAWPEDPG